MKRLLEQHPSLVRELRWLMSLRWFAGAAVIGLALAASQWSHQPWAVRTQLMVLVGIAILGYNAALHVWIRRERNWVGHPIRLLLLAGLSVVADLACLSLLTIWTGGLHSPLLGLFVLHMVFVSLLLPLRSSFVAAGISVAMVLSGLVITNQWPVNGQDVLLLGGFVTTLLGVSFVTDHITQSLRAHETVLERQQRALGQHEKMTAMGQLAAGVAHEISNPLASLDSVVQLAARQPESISKDTLQIMQAQIDRITTTIRQMTDFAHPNETGLEVISLNDVVERGMSLVRFDQRIRNVDIDRQLAADVGMVRVSPGEFEQVIVNIVRNALDALEDVPSPRLVIATSRRADECVASITDNGPGIQDADLPRIFEPFFTTKPIGHGTGLGLSISYRLIERFGGTLSARSTPGTGTTFTIIMPNVETNSSTREDAVRSVPDSEKK